MPLRSTDNIGAGLDQSGCVQRPCCACAKPGKLVWRRADVSIGHPSQLQTAQLAKSFLPVAVAANLQPVPHRTESPVLNVAQPIIYAIAAMQSNLANSAALEWLSSQQAGGH